MKNKYFIQEWDYEKYGPLSNEADQVAFMGTLEFANIFGQPMIKMADSRIEGLIKIEYNKKTIYRKFVANNLVAETQCVVLSYRSLAELGLDLKENSQEPKTVMIEPTSAITYLWYNSYAYIRKPFRWAVIGLILTLLFGVLTTILELIPYC